MRRSWEGRALVATVVLLLVGAGAPAHARAAKEQRYIVIYEDSVRAPGAATQRHERAQGFRARHRFRRVIKGFAATLSRSQARRLRDDRAVATVVRDRRLRATALKRRRRGETVPTGVRRIGAATRTRVREASGVRVAVLDSGIDRAHRDLNATRGVDCVAGPRRAKARRGTVHGTHVAGVIAARNNGDGVVGVAPGTEVVDVRVLGRGAGGWMADVICGIDWVTATRRDDDPDNDIAVANLSLGATGRAVDSCPATKDPLHAAICRSTAAGVTYVAAAGNQNRPFDANRPFVPAAYPEVLAVTAMADTDGRPGGRGPGGCSGEDVRAPFSNFAATPAGRAHTIAAPGSCILSTRPGGGAVRRGGTSVAAPHVAGLAALCHDEGGVPGVCAERRATENVELLADRARRHALEDGGFGFEGDPRAGVGRSLAAYSGHLAWGGADLRAPVVTIDTPASGARTVRRSPTFSGTAGRGPDDAEEVLVVLFDGRGRPEMLTVAVAGGTWSTKPLVPLPDGAYTLRVSQRDREGNVGRSGLRRFTVDAGRRSSRGGPAARSGPDAGSPRGERGGSSLLSSALRVLTRANARRGR